MYSNPTKYVDYINIIILSSNYFKIKKNIINQDCQLTFPKFPGRVFVDNEPVLYSKVRSSKMLELQLALVAT